MSGLTPGDPLGGETAPAERQGGLWSGQPGYTSPAPPGAGGPVPALGGDGLPARPVLAGWWRRAVAQVIDGVIISIGALVMLAVLAAAGASADTDGGVAAVIVAGFLGVLAFSIVALLYAPWLMARTNGRTLGRMATGIRVIRADGQRMTFGFAVLREVVVKALLVGVIASATIGIAWLIDVLWPLWDEENRALHDFVVNTRTIVD
jgi:uncharacterized RDD family membrane protein YckC